jgi:hypothetical protein
LREAVAVAASLEQGFVGTSLVIGHCLRAVNAALLRVLGLVEWIPRTRCNKNAIVMASKKVGLRPVKIAQKTFFRKIKKNLFEILLKVLPLPAQK